MRRSIRRLAFVTDGPHFGGAERYVVDVARTAADRGITPHVFWLSLPNSDPDVFGRERAGDLEVTIASTDAATRVRGLVRAFRAMLGHVKPDALVINACGRPRFWLIPWLARQANVPAVWVHQMVDGHDHRRIPPRWFGGRVEGPNWWRVPQTVRHGLAAAAATAVITLNSRDREHVCRWQRVPRDKVRVVPHGIDGDQFQFDSDGRRRLRRAWGWQQGKASPFVVGTAGRLVTGKRVDLLIEATAILRARGLDVVAAIAGRGPERDALQDLARGRGIADTVKFLDFADDMPAFYSALDAFVLCSDTESFGLALAEAMACERPVAATPTAGATRQIDHGHNGWQLRSFEPIELAHALAWIIADPGLQRSMGKHGRADAVREFSIEITLERTLRALRGSAGERSGLKWPGMNDTCYAGLAAEDAA